MRHILKQSPVRCAAWIAVCFSLTSAAWISWEYHLLTMVSSALSDVMTMIVGYALQAVGIGAAVYVLRAGEGIRFRKTAVGATGVFILPAVISILSSSVWGVLSFGLIMNLVCGVIAGCYLYAAALGADEQRRSRVFGWGYAVSTVFVYLLSLPGKESFLRYRSVLIVYAVLAAAAAWMTRALPEKRPEAPTARKEYSAREWLLAFAAIFLLSVVRNMGFSFPSADLAAGVNLELSRIVYAVGLVIAGYVNDKNRKAGAVCTLASLSVPFVMLAMSGEGVSGIVLWGMDYLFFGFFAVFRVVLTMDMASHSGSLYLAPLGLLAGRLGDAAGTGLCMGFAANRPALILITLGLFLPALFLFLRLCQKVYMPEAVKERSEHEIFDEFSMQHDLSAREKEVLKLILAEQTNSQIAETLFVSESTVKFHVHNLLQKTGCRSRQELIGRYRQRRDISAAPVRPAEDMS